MRSLLFFLLTALWIPLQSQIAGKLYISYTQNVTGLADSTGYYLYPERRFVSVAGFSARDMVVHDDIIFAAPQPGLGGRYDSLQAISVSTDQPLGKVPGMFTAGNIEAWGSRLVISCGEAPWLRVIDASPPYTELFNLPLQQALNREPFGLTVYQDRAYLWTDSIFCIVDLSSRQLEAVMNFPEGFLVQSEFNAVLGAADSAYLLISMGRNASSRDSVSVFYINHEQMQLEFRDQYVVSGLLAFPGVATNEIIHFSRYRAHYDPALGKIVPDVLGQTFLPGQASSYDETSNTLVVMEEASFNRLFLWIEHGDTIINNLTPLQLPERTVIVWSSLFIDNLTLPVISTKETEIQIFPNPARQRLWIEAPHARTFSLYSLQGEKMLEGAIISGKAEANLARFAEGTYLCVIRGEQLLHKQLVTIVRD
jgi:hypothetical protein